MFIVINFNSTFCESDKDVSCSSWTLASKNNTCKAHDTDENGFEYDWKPLDRNLNVSQAETCALRCRQEKENGCCYLSTASGCYWMPNANVVTDSKNGHNAKVVECSFTGTSQQLYMYLNTFCTSIIVCDYEYIRYVLIGKSCFDLDKERCKHLSPIACDAELQLKIEFDARRMCCACGGGASKHIFK